MTDNTVTLSNPFKGTTLFFYDVVQDEPEVVFAWLPVRCFDGKRAWLTPVYRRFCMSKPDAPGPCDSFYQYAKKVRGKHGR